MKLKHLLILLIVFLTACGKDEPYKFEVGDKVIVTDVIWAADTIDNSDKLILLMQDESLSDAEINDITVKMMDEGHITPLNKGEILRVVSMKYVDENEKASQVRVYSEGWNKEMYAGYAYLQKTD
ncbi:hypothetical protein [Paenibacillus tianjinensis]|uniref:DUF3221 domain-containing protein n=1 Tax=Paenibacillus tianjinensis TaxID=2810347 RepID=A0ABX7L8R6_9BACL|nr:hypothetical protein [Paenibacillus tianjinensis]QSF43429.1 hypothetical protein JRJ22_19385 [Paenibacillus tianjinensis]